MPIYPRRPSNIPVDIDEGGTGEDTAPEALEALGVGLTDSPTFAGATIAGLAISNNGTITTLLGTAGDYNRIGDAGTTSHSLASEDDLMVTGKLEVDGVSYFDSDILLASNAPIHHYDSTNSKYYSILYSKADDGEHFGLGSDEGYGNNHLIFCSSAYAASDFDHDTLSTNPTIFIHSATDPDSDNTQWMSLTHDQTDGVISVDKGSIKFNENIKAVKSITFLTETDNGNSGATDTIAWTAGNKQKSTLSESCTFTFTAPDGKCNLTLKCVNFGAFTPTWPGTVKWVGGTEPSWTASGTDICSFYYDGTSYYGAASLDFS